MKKYSIANNKLLFGIFSGWGSQVVTLAMGIFTMPLFFRYLPKDELGVWMFFLGTGFFVNLADLGFSPVMGRRLAFELGHGDKKSTPNYAGASYYYRLARYVSSLTAPLLFVCLLLVGGMFIWTLHLPETLIEPSLIAWAIFCLSQAVTCHFKYLETTLNGHGEVGWQNMTQAIVQGLTLLGYFFVLYYLAGGIIALSVVVLGRNIANASLVWILLQKRIDGLYLGKVKIALRDVKPHIRPALDMLLVSLGTFLILNTDQYFIVKFLGTDQLPDYAAAYRLVQIAYTLAATASTMCIPFISRKSAAGDHAAIHRMLMLNVTVGMLIQLAAVAVLAVFGDFITQLWLGPGHFVGWRVMWVFCVMLTLENHHVIFARFGLSAKADPTWGKMSLISGALNLAFTFVGVKWFGLIGVAVSTMLAQMLTNNWYAVVKTLRIINLRFLNYVRESGIVWLSTGIMLLIAMYSIRSLALGPVASLLAGLAFASLFSSEVLYLYLKKRFMVHL
jgi:O-antigen/teichoic acid export membrane protein